MYTSVKSGPFDEFMRHVPAIAHLNSPPEVTVYLFSYMEASFLFCLPSFVDTYPTTCAIRYIPDATLHMCACSCRLTCVCGHTACIYQVLHKHVC